MRSVPPGVSTLLTPLGDTVTYTFDKQSRPVGPYLRSGPSPLHSREPTWDQTGSLVTLTDSVAGASAFVPLEYDRNQAVDDPQPAGAPSGPSSTGDPG